MTCEETRAAMRSGGDVEWSSGVLAHLAGCDDCAAVAVELSLRQAPVVAVPPTFAADVARRARLDTAPEARRVSGGAIGAGAAAVSIAIALASFGAIEGTAAVVPVAALLLACGEAMVIAAWTLDVDVTRVRRRR